MPTDMNKTAQINLRSKQALNRLEMPKPLKRTIKLLSIAAVVNPDGKPSQEALDDNKELDVWMYGRIN